MSRTSLTDELNDRESPPVGSPAIAERAAAANSSERHNGAAAAAARPRIVIADDHTLLLDTLVSLMDAEFEVVAAVNDGEALIAATLALEPDLVLVDVRMPVMDGLEAGRVIHHQRPLIRLVYMTMDENPDLAAQAFLLGASGYLLKTCPASELLQALHIAATGGTYLTEAVAGGRVTDLPAADAKPTGRLSPREYAVLQLAVTGASMKEIARELGIAPRTVAFHKYRAMAALGLRRNSELVEFALQHGMLRPASAGR